MKNIIEIVDFYEEIKQKDLFQESVFAIALISYIKKELTEINEIFFNLIEKQALDNIISYKALHITYYKLETIYWNIDAELKNHLFIEIEQTPLFRYEIEYNDSLLTTTFSRIAVLNGISEIYWYLEKHFSTEINFDQILRESNYIPPYVDEEGYILHIYSKLIDANALKKDFYNYNNNYVSKINEFLQVIPSDIDLSLPIDCFEKVEEGGDTIVKTLEKELIDSEIDIDDSIDEEIFGDINTDPKFVTGKEIIYSKLHENYKSDEVGNEQKSGTSSVFSDLREADYKIEINCSDKEKAIQYLISLFNGLKEIKMVSRDTTDEDIISVFSGKHSDSRIIWSGFNNSIAYFFRQTIHVYGLFLTPNPRWEVICYYFYSKKQGNKFVAEKLETNSSYKNTKKMDAIIEKFRKNIKTL